MAVTNITWNTSTPAFVTVTGNSASKTSGDPGTPNGAALSNETLAASGAFVTFQVPNTTNFMQVGLSDDPGANSIMSHAWNFNATASAEIRESGVYKGEFAYVANDTFKIDITGTTVKYYINGVLKYTSLTAVVLPKHIDVTFTNLATINNAQIETGVVVGASPIDYDAITDLLIRVPGVTPTVAKAGDSFVDPAFGCRVLRATDGQSGVPFGMPANYSYRTPDAPNQMGWSAEGDRFYVKNDQATVLAFDFNRSTMVATPIGTVAFNVEPAFPRVTGKRDTLYGIRPNHVLASYNFVTKAFTTLLDLKTIDASLNLTNYTATLYVSGGTTERAVVNYGGTGQDLHMKVTIFDVNDPTNATKRRTIHTKNSTIDSGGGPVQVVDAGGVATTMDFFIHSISISNDGNTVRFDPAGTAAFHWLYDWTLNRFTKVTANPWGHYAIGWGNMANEDQAAGPKMQWQMRSLVLTAANTTAQRVTSIQSPPDRVAHHADHSCWHNANSAAAALAPFFAEVYANGGDQYGFWSQEIVAVQAAGAEKVWRFCHHRMNTYLDDSTTVGTFYQQPLLQVDPTGQFVAFSSNWDKTLGTHPNPPQANVSKRCDVFIVKLAREVIVVMPPPVVEPLPPPVTPSKPPRHDEAAVLISTLARSVSDVGPAVAFSRDIRQARFVLDVQDALGVVGDTLDVYIQSSSDSGYTWDDFIHFTQVLGNTSKLQHVAQWMRDQAAASLVHQARDGTMAVGVLNGPLGGLIRPKWIIAGSGSKTFTFRILSEYRI